MASISRTRTVAAPIETVWGVLADFGAISRWASHVDHSCLLEHGADASAVGTTRRVQVGRNTLVERITESAAPSVLAYDIEGLPHLLGRVGNRWSLESSNRGTTVTVTSTVEISASPLARIAEQAVCRLVAKNSDGMLAGLAARVEPTPLEEE